MHPSFHFATSISSSRTSRPRGTVCSKVESRSVRFATRRPLELGTEVSHPGSTPRARRLCQLRQLLRSGWQQLGATGTGLPPVCDVMWKVGDVDHTRRSKNTQEERSPSPLFSRSSIVSLLLLFSLRQKSKAMLAVAVTARCAKLASGYQKPEAKYSRVSPVPSAQMNLQWVVIDFSMLAIQWNMTCKCH